MAQLSDFLPARKNPNDSSTSMRRGFLLSRKRDVVHAPYPTRNKKPDRDDRPLCRLTHPDGDVVAPRRTDARSYTVDELKKWGKHVRLTDDPCMTARVDLCDLGRDQQLVFRNIKVGAVEISTLLDCAVLNLLPTRFSPLPIPLENAIEFRTAGAKGIGAFATQDLRAAALIHVEYPTAVTQNTIVLNAGMTMAETYRELINRVPERTRSTLLQLNNSQPPEMCGLEEGILRSNSVGIALRTPSVPGSVAMGHNAIFLETSRINHSCSPNVIHRFDPESFALLVHTICPIAKGEELVYSYIDLTTTLTREARRSLLHDLCHFECLCDRCALSDASAIRESDERRQRIGDTTREAILGPIMAWSRGKERSDLGKVIAFHLAAFEDMRREGLYHYPYLLHISMLAICFAALKDVRSFRSWMGRARDVAVVNHATAAAIDMLKYIVYPEDFCYWGWCPAASD